MKRSRNRWLASLAIILLCLIGERAVAQDEKASPEHQAMERTLKEASAALWKAYAAKEPDWTAARKAVGQLREVMAYMLRTYRPLGSHARPILDFLLQDLQNDFAPHKWPKPKSIDAGLQILEGKLRPNAPDRKDALAVAWIFESRMHTRFSEVASWMADQAPVIREKERQQAAAEKRKGQELKEAHSWTARIHRRFREMVSFVTFWLVVGVLFGFVSAKRNRRPGHIVLFPVIATTSSVVVAALYIPTGMPGWLGFVCQAIAAIWIYRRWRRKFPIFGPTTHGSARWGTIKDMLQLGRITKRGFVLSDSYGFALGRARGAPKDQDSRFRYMGHVLTCAPTGAGKGIGAVIPNLLEYPGSALVLDIKGENFAVTEGARRGMGQEVFLIDPFGVTETPGHGYNWLDRIKPDDPDVVSESAALADMLVIPDVGENAYWDDSARDLIRGLLIHVASLEDPNRRHIGEVRRLLTGSESDLHKVLGEMAASEVAFGVVARAANVFMAKADKDRSGVLSAANRHTSFLDDPRVVTSLSRSDFSLDDLKRKPMTVYVALPPSRLATYSRFMRGFVGLSLASITASKEKPELKVAFFLDEFAQLGRMSAIEDGISLVRGYGAVFWIFIQDLSQMKGVYPKWQTFLANSAKQFFGTADFDTARYISDSLGQTTIEFQTQGRSDQDAKMQGSSSTSQQFTGRSLLTPDEVMRLGPTPIVLINGEPPYLMDQINYLTDPEYQGLASPNPYHS